MTVSTIKAQSSSYLQKIINSDFDMGSINADGLKVDNLPNTENDKGVPKTENPTSAFKTANDKGVPIMKNGKGMSGMKTVSSVKSTVKDKSVPNAIPVSDDTENETIASVSSEEIFRDVKSIDSDDSTPTIVPKSPSFGRPYHIKTNGSLNSSSCPSDAEIDKPDMTRSLNDDMQCTNKQMKKSTLPKQNNVPKLQRRHSEMEGINKESYMIGNQFKVLSGTTSLERNIHIHHSNESTPAADEKRLSGWHTIGHSFQRKLGCEFDRTKRTTWGGKYASKQRESLKVLNELDNAYHYSSDSSGDHYYEANDRQRPKSLKTESGKNGVGLGVEDGGPDDVFISQAETEEEAQMYEENLQEYMSICMSGIYGIFVAVIGLVIPLANTFADPSLPFVFEAFYLYLYVMGILFIIYVYVFMMRKRQLRMTDIAKALSRRLSSSKTFPTSVSEQTKDDKPLTRQSINYPHTTGSFYLRLGALLFGVGSMIDSGLHFGQHFQAFDGQSMCNKPIEAAKPFGHLIFTFVQLYFIFLNSKLCIHNNRTMARFGMIHLCCTNICVWIQSLVVETLSVLHHWKEGHQATVAVTPNTSDALTTQIYHQEPTSPNSPNLTVPGSTPEVTCYWDEMMARVVQSTGPYLYSCTIEYSIICTGILFVMWTNVGTNQKPKNEATDTGNDFNTQNDDDISSLEMKRHKISVDCTSSSRGLFIGILVSVGAIVTMVAFYVMINLKTFQETAVVLMLLSEMTMYILTSIASFLAAERMHKLRHYSALKFGLEESLLLVSFTGLVMFGVFNIVPDVHYTDKAHGVLNVMTNVLMILQASIQTVLLLTTRKFRALNKEQEKGKYGRQFITFLILCNFAMWTLETFQAREPEHNPIQVEMYGIKAWALFSHITVPLGIFFRFHSFVYLLSIWKSAWKIKTETEQN